jgi:DNA-binding CsgD family transcriptional regulator
MSPRSATPRTALELGRESYDRQAWADAHALLSEADREGSIELEDLERLAIASHLLGRYAESAALSVRSYQESVRAGDVGRAARSAFWVAVEHLGNGEPAQAAGWLARAERLVGEGPESAETGYLLVASAAKSIAGGDPSTAKATYERAAEVGARFGDADLVVLARLGIGEALIGLQQTAGGVGLMDEAMASVTAGEVSPVVAGIVYCSVISSCQEIFDLRRAQEWTAALDRWCASQPQLVQFRGQCLLNRAVLMQFHGAWKDADSVARRATERLAEPEADPSLGEAVYRTAELHRLRGEAAQAEAAYRRASQLGRPPEPGMALLRLAQGRVEAAAGAIRRATDEASSIFARPRLLEPLVEITLAAGSIPEARAAADELAGIAADIGAPLLAAMAGRAAGAVRLAEDEPRAALAALRESFAAWRALDAPYEAARTRVLIGIACRALGDEDSASLELDAALEVFDRLGAAPDLARVSALLEEPGTVRSAGGLTGREVEVLRLVAAGKTNRAIAADLAISEKTVARHLSNVFDKLGVSSRAAATAYAYEHDLISRPA